MLACFYFFADSPMLNWSQIDTALLDMDGTLLDLHFDSHFWLEHLPRRYAELKHLDPEHARQSLLSKIEQLRGKLDWYCIDFWSDLLDLDVVALKRETRDRIAWRPHSKAFLERLRACGIRRVLVTNSHPDGLKLKIETTGIDQHLDRLFSSHSFGQPKEGPDFWEQLAQQEPFDPERTLLIDDSLPVLESASRYGIRHLLAILSPDSQQPPRQPSHHPCVHDFDELFQSLDQFAHQKNRIDGLSD